MIQRAEVIDFTQNQNINQFTGKEPYVDFKVMCEYFSIKMSTGREWTHSKGFPCIRIGTGPKAPFRYKLSEVEEWVKKALR